MTLSAVFRWKNADSTVDMNSRLQTLVPRGIFDGGAVSAAAGLTVNVTAFKAVSYDGMLVRDDAVQTIGVVANQTNYVVVRAKYVSGTTPTVAWEVLSQAAYNTDPEKNYLIVFAVITVPSGATSVASSYISTLERDTVDPMGRSYYRGNTVFASLPAHPPEQNRDGDFYFVNDRETFYWWNSSTTSWQPFTTGSYNVETGSMADVVIEAERNRKEQGSGVIGGIRPADSFASDPDITLIETPSVANQIGFDTFSAIVNGHYVQPYSRYVTLPAKPGGGTRYDLIFLEVYRESITVPENHDFPRNPDGSLTYTITQVSDQTEQILYQAGVGGNNFDLNELQSDDHAWVVTKYRIGTISGVTSAALQDNQTSAASATNVDGNPFAATPGTGIDERVWMATSTTSSDGVSWAIPLFVVKRTSVEDHTIGQAVQIYRSDVRWVFPVYPVADTSHAARLNVDTTARQQPFNYTAAVQPDYTQPSGFINGMDYAVDYGGSANTIRFYDEEVRVRIRGIEDAIRLNSSAAVSLGAAPLTGYERTLVYLKMCYTMYANSTTQAGTMISARHRPLVADQTGAYAFKGIGWKRGYVTWEVETYSLGAAATELDEADAMVSAGWTKGDASLAALGQQYSDGGIWSKVVATATDERVPIYGYEWAIPICLVHRRNKSTWNWSTNANGSGSARPDGKSNAETIHVDEILDLRRLVDADEARLAELVKEDMDKLMRGQLRTRMAEKWAGTAGASGVVAGTRILQSDLTDLAGTSAAGRLGAPNGSRKIWSDAKEFIPVGTSFDMGANYSDTYVSFTTATGAITISAPPGTYICRHLPAVYLANGDATAGTYLQYESQPLWTTRATFDFEASASPWPSPVEAKVISSAGVESALLYDNIGWTSAATDNMGHLTSYTGDINMGGYAAGDTCVVSFWVARDRTPTGTDYVTNYGLFEIPDEVHSVVKGPNGGSPSTLNVGAIYALVRKSVAASASVSITNTDVAAVSGLSGTHTIIGIDWTNIKYSTSISPVTLSSVVMNNAQTQLDITWSAPITAEVEFLIFFETTDVSEWVEIGKGGKSVRGIFSWENSKTHDWGGAPAATLAFDTSTSIWHDVEVADRFVPMPQIWTNNTGLGAAWTLWLGPLPTPSSFQVGYPYSNIISITNPGSSVPAKTDQYFKIIYPKWDSPAASVTDEILVHYTYTPYGGLSSTGGTKATAATALTKLKKMLHGTVEANTDHIVTQSGACSVFGGVDGWTGWPARRPHPHLNFGRNHFSSYVQTQLVKSTKAGGLLDLGSNSDASNVMPAAILRLPYPGDNSMVTATFYHTKTMDFDIDPGRDGVNAGYFSYAPGYPSPLTYYSNASSGFVLDAVYDQFVNGVSPLAIPGEPKQQDHSKLIGAAAYQPEGVASNDATFKGEIQGWGFTATQAVNLSIPIDVLANHVVARTMTAYYGLTFDGAPTTPDTMLNAGLYITHGLADFPSGANKSGTYNRFTATLPNYLLSTSLLKYTLPGGIEATMTDQPVFLCTAAGSALAFYMYSQYLVGATIGFISQAGDEVATRLVLGTFATIESDRQSYRTGFSFQPQTATEAYGLGFAEGAATDLVVIPMGSSSMSAGTVSLTSSYRSQESGASHLRGRSIGYPTSWNATTVSAVDSLVQASELFHSTYGRGLYFGSSTRAYATPVLVPGSGTPLAQVITDSTLPATSAQPPEAFPVAPATSPFATTAKRWAGYDHGGPLAWCGYGLIVNPEDDEYKGQAVLQVSGGPTLGTSSNNSSDQVEGTAIDSFWPSKRPLLRSK